MQKPRSSTAGFALVEVLLVIALIAIVSSAILPQLGTFHRANTIDSVGENLYQALYQAQSRAMHGYRDTDWGVAIQSSSFTVFAGTSYATRNSTYDEVTPMQGMFTLSGSGEIVFRSPLGTSSGGTLLVTGTGSAIRNIVVTPVGQISLTKE